MEEGLTKEGLFSMMQEVRERLAEQIGEEATILPYDLESWIYRERLTLSDVKVYFNRFVDHYPFLARTKRTLKNFVNTYLDRFVVLANIDLHKELLILEKAWIKMMADIPKRDMNDPAMLALKEFLISSVRYVLTRAYGKDRERKLQTAIRVEYEDMKKEAEEEARKKRWL